MMRIVLVLAAIASAGPYCVEHRFGRLSCHYYDANECKAAAYEENAMCIVNPENQRRQNRSTVDHNILLQNQPKSIVREALDGMDRANAKRMERERFEMERERHKEARASAAENEILLEADLKARAIAFGDAYPDKPNPYQEALDNRAMIKRDMAIRESSESQASRSRENDNRGYWILAGVLGGVLLLIIVGSAE